jgi:hypothetical protein
MSRMAINDPIAQCAPIQADERRFLAKKKLFSSKLKYKIPFKNF